MTTLRDYQVQCINAVREILLRKNLRSVVLQSPTGSGKCFGKNTPILMYDGTIKPVQDVMAGDLIMGYDSCPRSVTSTTSGKEWLYKITPIKGEPYIVNESHILSLKITSINYRVSLSGKSFAGSEIANVKLTDYLSASNTFKHVAKGWRKEVVFNKPNINNNLPPYLLGLWLGDGGSSKPAITKNDSFIRDYLEEYANNHGMNIRVDNSNGTRENTLFLTNGKVGKKNVFLDSLREYNLIKNKHIPLEYKTANRKDRLELLAGIIDTDGYASTGCLNLITVHGVLADDICYLCRSLGFAAYKNVVIKSCIYKGQKKSGLYYRVSISGHCSIIPCKNPKRAVAKRQQKKDVLMTGIKVEKQCFGNYYGFELAEENKLFLLGDFTVAHNTAIVSEITSRILKSNRRSWFVVPRKELVKQSSESFARWGIPHGKIDAANVESRAYKTHIVSLQTLIRRLGKIKEFPEFVFFDECHINYDAQERIFSVLPDTTKFIGLTATPGRTDNRGLGALYSDIVYGASIPYLTQCGFLAPLRYYAPPTDGVKNLKFKTTGEVDQGELDKLLTERAIYGRAVDYYEKLAKLPDGSFRRGVGFCAGVKAAEKQAAEFRSRGFRAEHIDGEMTEKKQRALLDGLADGCVQVLCSADLLLYGWDSPKVSYGFLLRRTKSKALFFQIVGRILRPFEDKKDAIFVDHTATVDLHTDPANPGVPPFFLDHIDWNFNDEGKEKKQNAPPPEVRLCPYDNFQVCTKKIRCPECERYIPNNGEEKIIESIPLQERMAQMSPHVITPAEKREYQDAVIQCVQLAREAKDDDSYDNAVARLCAIADNLQYRPMWCYWQLTKEKYTVNTRALHSIARAKNYKPYWAKKEAERIRAQLQEASA